MPRTPAEAVQHRDVQVFLAATGGRVPGVAHYRAVIETVRLLRTGKGLDDAGLAAYLAPFWHAWTGSRRQDGRPYNRDNLSWLTEWALNGTLPQSGTGSEPGEVIRAVARRKK